jgi:hypothetical protein
MIIGVSGKIGSGKDLVGNIIQHLTDNYTTDINLIAYNIEQNKSSTDNWKIVKFADKLKDCVCIILGCTREQLEDREFKEKALGEEWSYWDNKSLDVCKDTYKTFPKRMYLTEKEADKARDLYTLNRTSRSYKVKLTPRKLMQLVGTECGRNIIHPDVWVNATMVDYIKAESLDGNYPSKDIVFSRPNWVITDVRFPNEAQAITDRGGINIRIQRELDCEVCGLTKHERRGKLCNEITCPNGRPQHESETALDLYKFDYIINNDDTIEELIERVKEILLIEKII